MLKAIITYLNLKLELLNYFDLTRCLVELKEDSEGTRQPVEYISNGEFDVINFDEFNGVSYWRLRDEPSTERTETQKYRAGAKNNIETTIPLRLVFAVPRTKLTEDDAYSFDRIRQTMVKQFAIDDEVLRNQLGAIRVRITQVGSNSNAKEVWEEETEGTGTFEPKYETVFGSIDVDVVVISDHECLPTECDDVESDILRAFDWCGNTDVTVGRLTQPQQDCLSTYLCSNPDPVQIQVNGTDTDTAASGTTYDQEIHNTDGTDVGTAANPSIVADATIENSDQSYQDTVKAEGILVLPNITFTDSDGSTSSVPSVQDIVATPCSPAPTIEVTVSDNTPDYNADVDILATVTGFTPTSYTFQISCQDSGDAYVTQASNTLTWTVNRVGAIKVTVTATDGSNTQGETIEINVTDPLDYAPVLCDSDARNNLTLFNGEVDVIGDSSGNGHDVTASAAIFRAYIDTFGSRIASKPVGFEFENSTSNPISGKANFTLFFKAQKLETAAANQRLVSFGTIGQAFAIAAVGTVGVDDLIVGDTGFSCRQDYQVGLTEGATVGVVKNGTDPYECYVDGSLATPVSTSGTPIANIATQNGMAIGSQNSSFNFTGIFQRLIIFDTGSFTAAQMEAINLRIKQLHP